MFRPGEHATLLAGDPGRTATLAMWPDPRSATQVEVAVPLGEVIAVRNVQARLVPIGDALDPLVSLRIDADVTRSVQAWAHVARVALQLIARGRIHPAASLGGADSWKLGPLDATDRAVRAALAEWLPPEAHATPFGRSRPLRLTAPINAIASFYDAVADVLPRTAAAPFVARHWAFGGQGVRPGVDFTAALPPDSDDRAVLGLRLNFPEEGDPFTIDLQLRSALDPSVVIDADTLWTGAAVGFGHEAEADLLVGIRRASRLWPALAPLLDEPTPSHLEVADEDALLLLGPLATSLGSVGVEVLAPAAMTRSIRAAAHVEPPPGAGDSGSRFDLSTLCELTWQATIDGDPLTPAELSQLAESRRPLVRLRDEWVVVDPRVLAQLTKRQQVTAADAIAGALGGELRIDGELTTVELGSELETLTARLHGATTPHDMAEPDGLLATLRPYQRRGLGWLSEMADLGFGGILADDMGLGKTVQLIALHLARMDRFDPRPTLVACPATLVANWESEMARFAPTVPVRRYHGTDRTLGGIVSAEVVITTYGVVRRDHELLSEIPWGLVVADEAQQIKNPNASISKALRTIPGEARLAMTGTPVENRLTELWALLDWTTPGLLGGVEAFRRNLAIPIERDRDAESTARLGRLVAPFVLRRRKIDPDVAPDLPPKIETDHPVTLSAEQAGLYRAVVEESLEQIEKVGGMARRGLVLKLLTALKQICNHPAHYLHQPGPLAGRSGKLDAFDDLIDAIVDAGDSALVFTQYVTMGNLLSEHLDAAKIGNRFLHGSLTLPRRAEMVSQFQAGEFPVFLISLKAGGTGLNLTKATHVIHYDRWWNPAVESQASDRAWRIGQDRTVQIHRLISTGTLEERIATVLAEKAELAEAVVGGGEAWLTELSDADLAELVQLGTER